MKKGGKTKQKQKKRTQGSNQTLNITQMTKDSNDTRHSTL